MNELQQALDKIHSADTLIIGQATVYPLVKTFIFLAQTKIFMTILAILPKSLVLITSFGGVFIRLPPKIIGRILPDFIII